MRNIVVSLFLLCVGLIIVGGCGPSKEEIQKHGIQEAMRQVNGNWNTPKYQVDKIDLRSCPADFQEAFIMWKSTEQPPEIKKPSGTGIILFTDETPEETAVRKEKENLKKAAWMKVETVALRYGVQTGMR